MGKLLIPQRLTNPLYRAKRYVDMRAGMPDPAREERAERQKQLSARQPVVRSGTPSAAGGAGVGLPSIGLTDPGADRFLGWDDSAAAVAWFSPGYGVEFDGTTARASGFYLYQDADYIGTSNSAAAQKFFDESTNGAANVAASTVYAMQGWLRLRTTDIDSAFANILFGGTATLNWINYRADIQFATAVDAFGAGASFAKDVTVATATALSGANATAKVYTVLINGHVSINGAGTFIPQYSWNAANQTNPTTGRGSWFRLTPVPATTIGSWS